MTNITLEEATDFASKYFKLLIDRHVEQGFSAKVVERKENSKTKNISNFYLEFQNEQNNIKSYKLIPNQT
jgi:hypothetical protein